MKKTLDRFTVIVRQPTQIALAGAMTVGVVKESSVTYKLHPLHVLQTHGALLFNERVAEYERKVRWSNYPPRQHNGQVEPQGKNTSR